MLNHGRRRFSRTVLAASVAGACGLALAGHAQDPPAGDGPPLFDPAIKRVAVFKNGYAFIYREGDVKSQGGWAATKQAPMGVLGTVWGYSATPDVMDHPGFNPAGAPRLWHEPGARYEPDIPE